MVEVVADYFQLSEDGIEPLDNDNFLVKGARDEVSGHGYFRQSCLEPDRVEVGLVDPEGVWFFRHAFIPFSADFPPGGAD